VVLKVTGSNPVIRLLFSQVKKFFMH